MAELEVRVVVRFAWWVRLYLWAVSTFATLHGLSPDVSKVERVMRAGMRVTVLDAGGRPMRAARGGPDGLQGASSSTQTPGGM